MHNAPGFAEQKPVQFTFCDYPLEVPSGHIMLGLFTPRSGTYQPYRDVGLVKIVQSLQALNRSGTAIDVGANVGDSCAIIHRHSGLQILCIEASDFFFPYLVRNVERLFADRAVARQAFVVAEPGEAPRGLYHWGGTAKAVDSPFTESCGALAISDLLASVGDVALLKIDIDGDDVDLLSAIFSRAEVNDGHSTRFPIYFEYGGEPETMRQGCAKLLALLRKAITAGYTAAFLWDDPGRFFGLIALCDETAIINATNYMAHYRHRSIWNYDICLVHQSDVGFASELCRLISRDSVMPLNIRWCI
jgi:FkbM family methyltransferase